MKLPKVGTVERKLNKNRPCKKKKSKKSQLCSRSGLNRGPRACKAHVISTTPRKRASEDSCCLAKLPNAVGTRFD